MNETLMKTEYSKAFDEKRKGLIEQSYYKYGPARMNFAKLNDAPFLAGHSTLTAMVGMQIRGFGLSSLIGAKNRKECEV